MITTKSEKPLTVETGPPVITSKALTIFLDGVEIGHLSATYDFSELPPEYYELAIQIMNQQKSKVYVSSPLPEELQQKLDTHRRNLELGYIGRFGRWLSQLISGDHKHE